MINKQKLKNVLIKCGETYGAGGKEIAHFIEEQLLIKKKLIIVSGGFDPLHLGHIDLFKKAKQLGDKLLVIVNNDNWLKQKKGYNVWDENTRANIISNLSMVDYVVITDHVIDCKDTSVCGALTNVYVNYNDTFDLVFANGGDRKANNVPEYEHCKNLNIDLVFGIGGEKRNSSSDIINNVLKQIKVNEVIKNE